MRIRVRASRRGFNQIMLNLTSMIDVVFLLLIYFIVTMAVLTPEDHLSPTIQTENRSDAGQQNDFQPQVIEVGLVDGLPGYRLGSQVLRDKGSLVDVLESLPKEPGVFVRVNRGVSVGFAAAALQAARDVGFEKVTYVPVE